MSCWNRGGEAESILVLFSAKIHNLPSLLHFQSFGLQLMFSSTMLRVFKFPFTCLISRAWFQSKIHNLLSLLHFRVNFFFGTPFFFNSHANLLLLTSQIHAYSLFTCNGLKLHKTHAIYRILGLQSKIQ